MRSFFAILVILLLSSSCALLGGRKIEKPKVKVESVDIRDASLTSAALVFGLSVDNPNPFALKVDAVDYALKVGNDEIARGALSDLPGIPASGSGMLSIPITVNLGSFVGSVAGLISKQELPYEITGSARLGLFKLPFKENGQLRFEGGKIKKVKN